MTNYISNCTATLDALCYFAIVVYFYSYAALLVHEAGHFISAYKMGMAVSSVSLGAGTEELAFRWKGMIFRFHRWPTSGFVGRIYPSRKKWKNLVFILSGPGANMLLVPLMFSTNVVLQNLGTVSMIVGIIQLLPTFAGDSDGSIAIQEFKRDAYGTLTRPRRTGDKKLRSNNRPIGL